MLVRSLLAMASLLLVACSASPPATRGPAPAPPPADAPPKDGPWKIGAYLSLSGGESAFGADAKDGITLAVDETNARGGARGRPLSVAFADTRTNPQEALNVALQLIEEQKVVALLGELVSSRSKVVAIVANERGVPMITPSATHPDVTRVGPFIFRACFNDDAQGVAAARYVVNQAKKKRVGIFFVSDDPYSSALAKVFRDGATALGASVVAEKQALRAETNYTAPFAAIAAAKPDAVFVPVYYNMMPAVAKAAKAAGLRGDRLVGSDGWASDDLLRDAGDLLEGAVFTDHWIADAPWPAARAFVDAFRARFKHEPSSVAANAHDAAKVLADALGRASKGTPEGIREAIAATRGLAGATGTITMGAGGEPDKEVVIVRIEGRRFRYHAAVRTGSP